MRFLLLVCVVGLALTLNIAVLATTSDDLLASFDPHDPATLLPILADRAQDVSIAARERLQELLDWFTAPYRERLHRTNLLDPLPE